MSRVIKFRAWDIKNEQWIRYPILSKQGLVFLRYDGGGHVLSNVEVMQFTGLLDKNGKDIYEADRLRDEDGDIGTVEFDAGHFIIRHANGTSDFIAERNKFVIVGNKYEG